MQEGRSLGGPSPVVVRGPSEEEVRGGGERRDRLNANGLLFREEPEGVGGARGAGRDREECGDDPPDPSRPEGTEREAPALQVALDDRGDAEPGDHEERIDPGESPPPEPGEVQVKQNHRQDCNGPQSVDLTALLDGRGPGPGPW